MKSVINAFAVAIALTATITIANSSVAAQADGAAASTPPSPAAQALIDKAQAAINAAGDAAKGAFDVEVIKGSYYPISTPDNVRIVHKATGMQCGVDNEEQIEIKVYRTDDQGLATDVSCDMSSHGTTHTLYAFKHVNSSVDIELDHASLGITLLHADAVRTDKSPLDTFEDLNRYLTLRDYDTIKDTQARAFIRPSSSPRGLYESVWMGKKGDWYIEQRSTTLGYYNWLAGNLWHAVWYNMLPDVAVEEDKHIKDLVETRQKAESANSSAASH